MLVQGCEVIDGFVYIDFNVEDFQLFLSFNGFEFVGEGGVDSIEVEIRLGNFIEDRSGQKLVRIGQGSLEFFFICKGKVEESWEIVI